MKACRARGLRGGQLGPRTRGRTQDVRGAREKGLASIPNPQAPFSREWASVGHAKTPQATGSKNPSKSFPAAGARRSRNWNQRAPGGILERVARHCTQMLALRGSLAAQTTGVSVTHTSWAAPQQRGPAQLSSLWDICRKCSRSNICPSTSGETAVLPSHLHPSVSFCPSWPTLTRSPWAQSTLSTTCMSP